MRISAILCEDTPGQGLGEKHHHRGLHERQIQPIESAFHHCHPGDDFFEFLAGPGVSEGGDKHKRQVNVSNVSFI